MAKFFPLAHPLIGENTESFPGAGDMGTHIGAAVLAQVAMTASILLAVIDRRVLCVDHTATADITDGRV